MLTVAKYWAWLSQAVKGNQEIRPWDKSVGQGMPRETASREQEDTDTSRKECLESIRRIQTVPVERRSTSREHRWDSDLRDLLEVQVEASEKLIVEPRSIMTPLIQSRCSSEEVAKFLKDEGSNLVGPKSYLLLKQNVSHHLTSSFSIGWLKANVGYEKHDGRPPNRIAFHVAYVDCPTWYVDCELIHP